MNGNILSDSLISEGNFLMADKIMPSVEQQLFSTRILHFFV